MNEQFRALVATKSGDSIVTDFQQLSIDDLPAGEVLVSVRYSSLNFKDGMILAGDRGKVVKRFPMIPGIDFSGIVEHSGVPQYKAGDRVVVTGWGLAETAWGGYSQKARVPSEWLVPIPENISLMHAMTLGTAGLTAAMCVDALERHGLAPRGGDVLVTGAAGGVGSLAVALLGRLGCSVTCSVREPREREFLEAIGSASFIDHHELEADDQPLGVERWDGAVDCIGGQILANIMSRIRRYGAVAVVGSAGGASMNASVLPMILRGVSLLGIYSVLLPHAKRLALWQRLARDLPPDLLESLTTVVPLSDVLKVSERILRGELVGRTVVDVNA